MESPALPYYRPFLLRPLQRPTRARSAGSWSFSTGRPGARSSTGQVRRRVTPTELRVGSLTGLGAGLVQVSAAGQFDRDLDPLDPFVMLSEPQPGAIPSRLALDLDRGPAGPIPEVRLPPPGVTEREDPSFVPAHRSIRGIMVDTLTIIPSARIMLSLFVPEITHTTLPCSISWSAVFPMLHPPAWSRSSASARSSR